MLQTFTNIPKEIEAAITRFLSQYKTSDVTKIAEKLHQRYMDSARSAEKDLVYDPLGVAAYLTLRVPATYAQIMGALLQVQELLPNFRPKSILDIGAGVGMGIWAANAVFPGIKVAKALDKEQSFISAGKQIQKDASIAVNISWQLHEVTAGIGDNQVAYDLVVIANVLNELEENERTVLVKEAFNVCSGVVVIVEPGTPVGVSIIQTTAQEFAETGNLLAPYIDGQFVADKNHWIHFNQRFVRPEFLRRFRQKMREASLMASDWEQAKYAYVALSTLKPEVPLWGRVIGPVEKEKGYLEVPLLTKDSIIKKKVLRRNKPQYSIAKKLRWGEIVLRKEDIALQQE